MSLQLIKVYAYVTTDEQTLLSNERLIKYFYRFVKESWLSTVFWIWICNLDNVLCKNTEVRRPNQGTAKNGKGDWMLCYVLWLKRRVSAQGWSFWGL